MLTRHTTATLSLPDPISSRCPHCRERGEGLVYVLNRYPVAARASTCGSFSRGKVIMDEEVQLDFENQMFIELLAQDGMVVLAR